MNTNTAKLFNATAAAVALAIGWAPANAHVTRVVIDARGAITNPVAGGAAYEQITGRAFGELDPNHPQNALITDLRMAPRNGNGNVEYIASFVIRKPLDNSAISGVMWHDVPNRGGNVNFPADSFGARDVHLLSGWQGDNAGATAVPLNAQCLPGPNGVYTPPCAAPALPNHYVVVPTLQGVTGRVLARIVNKPFGTGANAHPTNQPLNVQNSPVPYFPAKPADPALPENHDAELKVRLAETVTGEVVEGETISNADWKFCYGATATFANPLPGPRTLPVRICLDGSKRQFDATKLYQVIYTASDPYVLGAGTAAFRDVGSFFRYETDPARNPLAGTIKWQIIRGSSQSGNFTRHLIHLGMNQDEAGRIVHEGAWPLIAGRRVSNNSRWGQPDGVLELYQMGSEGPQWWHSFPDHVRDVHPGGILDRCSRSHTCPKIVETFGGAEVFALKMTTSWVGTDPKTDIPLPKNVRRYYLPSSTHGGGSGAMNENPPHVDTPNNQVNCPGNNYGRGNLRANPVPATALVNRMRLALRDWVMKGTEPPPSKWPLMRGPKGERTLVEATQEAMGFPNGIPEIRYSIFAPESFVFPVFDYDWGPEFDHFDATGNPTNLPPRIRAVVKMMVPKVNADGNELGGVPTVLNDAPLGTYLGWNITAGVGDLGYDGRPFHAGQVCDYVGGMVPFAKTKAQRLASGDPRLSLEERYGTHDGYVAAVRKAADDAACQGYLVAGPQAASMGAKCAMKSLDPGVQDDWVALVNQATNSNVCNQAGDGGKCNPAP